MNIKAFLLLFSTCLNLGLLAQSDKIFTAMDVFDLEWVDNPQISPDGKTIIYIRKGMDIMTDKRIGKLWMINADGKNHQKLSSTDHNESNPTWSPDGSKLAFTTKNETGPTINIYYAKSQKVAKIAQLEKGAKNLTWSPDGKYLAYASFVSGEEASFVTPHKAPENATWADPPRVTTRLKHEADGSGYMKPGFNHLFTVPADGGTIKQITSGDFHHRGTLAWTKNNEGLIFSGNRNEDWEYDFRNSELYHISLSSKNVTPLTNRKGPDRNPAISPDGKQLAYIGFDDKVQTYQVTHLYLMDMKSRQATRIETKLDRSISSPTWKADGSGIYVQFNDKGDTKIALIKMDGSYQILSTEVGGTSVARPYSGGSFSVSNNGIVALTKGSPYHPAELAVQNPKQKSSRQLMSLNDDLLEDITLGKVEEIWYNSSVDERPIQGWIVYPPDYKAGKQYPLLVENHGGPISNYGPFFSPEIQLYASAGYIVFYPNPRGSTGYGEEFGNLLYNNYPGDDYHDVMDGVDAIIEKGIIADGELYVTGGSAGGIMTAWMIGKNNRFKSAAVIKPVMNWISKTLVADNYYGYANSRYPGQPWENFEGYWKFSPLSLVGNIETPTLVMVGTADMRTPTSEAKQLYHALRLRKIETAYVEIPGSYHFIANRPSQLITKVEHILAWFERYRSE